MKKKPKKPEWYNACDDIAKFSLPLIKKLRAKGNGIPSRFSCDKAGKKEWHKILDDIIWTWENNDDFSIETEYRKQIAMEDFGKFFYSFWD